MATAAFLAPTGCSIGDEDPKPASGPAADVASAVERLEGAIRERDFAAVCDEIFTAAARERSGGEECARQLRAAAEGVSRPSIGIRGIDIEGERATVEVTTTARGQARVRDELRLRRQDGRWRVDALR